LVAQAKGVGPSQQIDKVQAQIAFHENNIEGAITYLEGSIDTGSLQLLAALHLENRNLQKAHELLFSAPLLDVQDPETHRLKALYHLTNHNVIQARIEIEKALVLQSNWTAIQFAAAIILYFHAIALNGLPKPLWFTPQPIPWVLIKRDEVSLMHLHVAERIFKRLLDEHEMNDQLHNQASAWRLACLASHPDYQTDANTYCQELVSQDHTHPMFVEWAIARRFEIDFEASKKDLQRLVNAIQATLAHIQALYHLYMIEETPDAIIQLLDQTKLQFIKIAQENVWADWYGRAILLRDGSETTLAYIEQSVFASNLNDLRRSVLFQKAEENNDRDSARTTLETEYEVTQNPYQLFLLCDWLAHQNDWETIDKWGGRLLKLLPTWESLALVVIAHYNLNHYQICLGYLEEHKLFYRSLPLHLQHIQSECYARLGKFSQAIESHQKLATASPSVPNLANLAYMYQLIGDKTNFTEIARQLLDRPDLDTTTSLQLAQDLPDTKLAAEFLQHRLPVEKLPDEQVVVALKQALELGLQKEVVNTLRERLDALGPSEHSGYYKLEWNEVVEWVKQWHQNARATIMDLSIAWAREALAVTLNDDGKGFEANVEPEQGHFGLLIMAQRAAEIKSDLMVISAPGRGTHVSLRYCLP
jgi:Flp pilus assembly protein TadD